ncbi:PREDICTED: hexaprenyldihydroxybenzoate methyltransferase, mitochondrial-like [Wasmannia auropunctata]|uniref:hexaprenyldihydroxybenzoate methyltransferase, mitochondrial-like n=1 Tax=Wasmannia auropunctata TaxID=64793 RepID=UPI0005EE70B7|nr:PREDICTED: hexaprenyldihydroxybenzoate methyltransferase, mitochondrial-like [Wasmannia auropunctata]XP_011700937.1 PREDICTED: hexaprenyldihydroxybenzoate methyltransferase, mitochondrial-like [Wasmannia auropunctata]XP_011700938.1 PREDICTED: hexaprenyldihydroxybenzoate methyltransferase, mitochondrial-like [Wasmannia auropunctata]
MQLCLNTNMITLNALKHIIGSWKSISRNRLSRATVSGNTYIKIIARSISTVDPKEVENMSRVAHKWWDENGPTKALHLYNPLRIQLVKDGLVNAGIKMQNSDLPLKEMKIAEVGCGGGILTEALARIGAQVTGIDVSAELLNIAKEHVKLDPNISKRVNYIQTTVEDFAENERETYDAVVTSEVLEHVTDPQMFLKECVKIVKPGKSIFITTINRTLTSWLSTIVATEYIFGAIPRGTHTWSKFIAPHDVQHILKNYGCEMKLIYGFKFNSLINKWSWSSTTPTFYGLHAIKQNKSSI